MNFENPEFNKTSEEIANIVSELMDIWYDFYDAFKKVANWYNNYWFKLSEKEFKEYIVKVWKILNKRRDKYHRDIKSSREELQKILQEEREIAEQEKLEDAYRHEKFHTSRQSDP